MKIKMHVVITDTEAFAKCDYGSAITLFGHAPYSDDYIDCGEIELDINPNLAAELDKRIGVATALITDLQRCKNELLAITHEVTE